MIASTLKKRRQQFSLWRNKE